MKPASSERVAMWADSALEATEFLSARYRNFAFEPHLHETFAIGLIERGGQAFRPGRSAPLIMPEGHLCVINPGTVHEGRSASDDGWQYRMFYPSKSLVARALCDDDGGTGSRFADYVIDDPELFAEFRSLHLASELKEPVLEREVRTVGFLRRLFGRHAASRAPEVALARNNPTVSVIRSFLHAHFDQPVRLAELAKAARVSETHVIRAFSAALGMPPHSYLLALRVEHAKALLRHGDAVAQVALDCGFHDQSQLTRHFRRRTGATPARYRSAFQ